MMKWNIHGKNYFKMPYFYRFGSVVVSVFVSSDFISMWHYKIFCVNVKYGIQYGFRIFYLIALQNEENYEREESCSA